MNFKDWYNESVFFNDKFKGWALSPQQLNNLSPEKKRILRDTVMEILADEGWDGRNANQFVNAVRHKALDYDVQMDKLRTMPPDIQGRCQKIPERINNVKMAYYLVQAIINNLAPASIKDEANRENYAWLKKSYQFYKDENSKLGGHCDFTVFAIPPGPQGGVTPQRPVSYQARR